MATWQIRWTRGPNLWDRWERQAISEPSRPFLVLSCPTCRTGTTIDSEGIDLAAAIFVHCCGKKESVPKEIQQQIRAGKPSQQ